MRNKGSERLQHRTEITHTGSSVVCCLLDQGHTCEHPRQLGSGSPKQATGWNLASWLHRSQKANPLTEKYVVGSCEAVTDSLKERDVIASLQMY